MAKRRYASDARERILGAKSLLGSIPDGDVAQQLGVSRSSVANVRKELAIPPAPRASAGAAKTKSAPKGKSKAKRTTKARGRRRNSKVAAAHDILGTISDRDVASKIGVSAGAVLQYRQRHGIPAYRRGRATDALPPEPGEAPKAAKAPEKHAAAAGTQHIWRLLGPAEPVFVVATDIVGAAQQAATLSGHVGLKHVGTVHR